MRLHGVAIGYSDLEDADESLGRARGRFRPGTGYDLVQPVFRLFSQAVPTPGGRVVDQEKLARYHRSRDALQLTLEGDDGRVIAATSIHISDYSHRRGGTIELEVLLADDDFWSTRGR